MDISTWQRRRRRAIAFGVGILLLGVLVAFVVWALAPQWRASWALLWIVPSVGQLALAIALRPRRLRARLDAVAETIGDAATATLVLVDGRQATWWLGARGFVTQWLVLVDDGEGYALWDARRRGPVEVLRRSWSDVETALVRTDGTGVDLVPADPADPTIRIVPTGFRDDPPQTMQTPRRQEAFAARLRARIRAVRPDAAPEPPAAGRDVDWLAPPDRTRPPR